MVLVVKIAGNASALIDRGPANDACLEMVWRLMDEAPTGRVRYHVGNHEMAILVPSIFCWPDTYSTGVTESSRRAFLEGIVGGKVTAAFEGHNYTYSHAGSNDTIDAPAVNSALREATSTLLGDLGSRIRITHTRANRRPVQSTFRRRRRQCPRAVGWPLVARLPTLGKSGPTTDRRTFDAGTSSPQGKCRLWERHPDEPASESRRGRLDRDT